jgi:hypothetical protein
MALEMALDAMHSENLLQETLVRAPQWPSSPKRSRVLCYPSDSIHVDTGYGIDAPVVRDLAADQIARQFCGTTSTLQIRTKKP